MQTVRLVVRYDGAHFAGWQRQRGVTTVQEVMEDAVATMVGERVVVRASGRTDAGVHALAQVAAFRSPRPIHERGWKLGLTSRLPPQISVTDARHVQDGFDPRKASAGKRYRYLLHRAPIRDPMLHQRAWHLHSPVDLGRMRREAEALVGTHDFNAFRAADCERETSLRTVFRVAVLEGFMGRDDLVAIEVEGTAFLKNMVRVIVGTLVDVGRDRLPEGTVVARLADLDRTRSGMTAPADGLYLDEVWLHPQWLLDDDVLKTRPAYAETYVDEYLARRGVKLGATGDPMVDAALEGPDDNGGDR